MIRILQLGGGSMGTRRIRDLSARKDVVVALHDARPDRRVRAADRFGIETFETLDAALAWRPHALSISTPPDAHDALVDLALERGLHHFCEANIWTPDAQRIETISLQKRLVSAPSNSLAFLPVVQELARIVREELGGLHLYQMTLSTYLPDWHPGEGREFYAQHRATTAAREMVPFELLGLNAIFGPATSVAGSVSRRGRLAIDSEDTWSLQMRLASGASAQLSVLMGCPLTWRSGWCMGDNGIIEFDLAGGRIARHLPALKIDDDRQDCGGTTSPGGVLEAAYLREIHTFVDAIQEKCAWPHPYRTAAIATATLAAAERSAVTARWQDVDPLRQPARLPDEYE